MRKPPKSSLQVVDIDVDLLDPNPWNVNRMSDETMAKLADYIAREGLVEPIVVRRLGERFEILGGEHRFRICSGKLGYKTMPCVIVDLDDRRAKILSINLNEMSGQPVPALLASLLHDLNRDTDLADLERLLPYQRAEMADLLQLLRLPEGLEKRLEEEAKLQDEEMPIICSVALSRAQHAVFDAAMVRAKSDVGDGTSWKGRALELMARAFLASVEAEGEESAA
jgi:ParB/RepB/Spo0J family partition protein